MTSIKNYPHILGFTVTIFIVLFYLKITASDDYGFKDDIHQTVRNYEPSNEKSITNNQLFCLVKTTPKALKSNKTLTTFNIWASRCSNYRFVTLIPEELLSLAQDHDGHKEIAMPFYVVQPEGLKVEKYRKITDKLYSGMRYIYSRFRNYNWYLIADDDAYINMENMMMFLKNKNPNSPVTYGHDFKISVEQGFHSGGCGYLLSREAFNRVGRQLTSNSSFCQNTGIDDVDLNACLRVLGVRMNSSLDDLGRERFLPVNFLSMYLGPVPNWLYAYSANRPQQGKNCCSDTIVGIHYMPPKQQILLDIAFKSERLKTERLNKLMGSNSSLTFEGVVETFFRLGQKTANLSDTN